jgi:DNA replication protein DnaC
LARRPRYYSQRGLPAIDEIDYPSCDARAADFLFQAVSRRDEHRSLVLTTNLRISKSFSIFPNTITLTALIDRVVHHADLTTTEGDSYRRREAESDR